MLFGNQFVIDWVFWYVHSQGFHINSAVLQIIVSRYANTEYTIDFDSFVDCLIRLEMLFSKSANNKYTSMFNTIKYVDLFQFRWFCFESRQRCLRHWIQITQGRLNWIFYRWVLCVRVCVCLCVCVIASMKDHWLFSNEFNVPLQWVCLALN